MVCVWGLLSEKGKSGGECGEGIDAANEGLAVVECVAEGIGLAAAAFDALLGEYFEHDVAGLRERGLLIGGEAEELHGVVVCEVLGGGVELPLEDLDASLEAEADCVLLAELHRRGGGGDESVELAGHAHRDADAD
jgi:hypothetical protein